MIKAIATDQTGRQVLIIGLSFGNLQKLKANPRDDYIWIKGKETGDLPIDVMIFSAENEGALAAFARQFVVKGETVVHEDPNLPTGD